MKNTSTTLRLMGLFIGGLILSSMSSCLKDNDYDEVPIAAIYMVNAYVSSNGVIYARNEDIIQSQASGPLLYQQYGYFTTFPNNTRIRIYTDDDEQLIDESYTFKDSTYYTSFIYGQQEDIHHLMSEDKPLDGLRDRAAIRFVHLSPTGDKVSVYMDGSTTPLYQARTYEGDDEAAVEVADDHLTFTPQASGTHKFVVKNEAGEILVEREEDFKEGWHYSLILIGDNSIARPLYLGVVQQYK